MSLYRRPGRIRIMSEEGEESMVDLAVVDQLMAVTASILDGGGFFPTEGNTSQYGENVTTFNSSSNTSAPKILKHAVAASCFQGDMHTWRVIVEVRANTLNVMEFFDTLVDLMHALYTPKFQIIYKYVCAFIFMCVCVCACVCASVCECLCVYVYIIYK